MTFNLSVVGLIVAITHTLAFQSNAEPISVRSHMVSNIDPVEDPTGLLPSASTDPLIKISEDDTVGREPLSKTIRLENEANVVADGSAFVPDSLELFVDSVGRSFRSGDNFANQVYRRYKRETLSPPPDPAFDSGSFIARNRNKVPRMLERQFHLATSDTEANLMMQDINQEQSDREMLLRRYGRPAEYRQPIF